jgi:hypothetical protein
VQIIRRSDAGATRRPTRFELDAVGH